MSKDVRKEQLFLLKFEKKLTGLAAFLAAGSATAASAADKINAETTMKAYEDVRDALVRLAEVTGQAHQTLQQCAADAGARALQVGGGMPKPNSPEVVRSLLGLG